MTTYPQACLSWKIKDVPECRLPVTCGKCGNETHLPFKLLIQDGYGALTIGELVGKLKCHQIRNGVKCGGKPSRVTLRESVQVDGKGRPTGWEVELPVDELAK